MKPDGSWPHSKVPATYPYPEPRRSSSCSTSHFLKIHLNITLPSMPGSSKWSLSPSFPHQNPVYTSAVPNKYYMPPPPSHSSRIDHPNNMGEEVGSLSSSLCSFLQFPVTLSLLGPNILLNTLFSNTLNLHSSLKVSDQISHPFKTTGKIIVLYIIFFVFLDSKLKDKRFCHER